MGQNTSNTSVSKGTSRKSKFQFNYEKRNASNTEDLLIQRDNSNTSLQGTTLFHNEPHPRKNLRAHFDCEDNQTSNEGNGRNSLNKIGLESKPKKTSSVFNELKVERAEVALNDIVNDVCGLPTDEPNIINMPLTKDAQSHPVVKILPSDKLPNIEKETDCFEKDNSLSNVSANELLTSKTINTNNENPSTSSREFISPSKLATEKIVSLTRSSRNASKPDDFVKGSIPSDLFVNISSNNNPDSDCKSGQITETNTDKFLCVDVCNSAPIPESNILNKGPISISKQEVEINKTNVLTVTSKINKETKTQCVFDQSNVDSPVFKSYCVQEDNTSVESVDPSSEISHLNSNLNYIDNQTVSHVNAFNSGKITPQNKLQFRTNKRNFSKSEGIKKHVLKKSSATPATLKHVEQIAETLNGVKNAKHKECVTITKLKTINEQGLSLPSKAMVSKQNLAIEDSILAMRNLNTNNKDEVSFLRQSLIANLHLIVNFTTELKECPVVSTEMIPLCAIIQQNLLALTATNDRSISEKILTLSSSEKELLLKEEIVKDSSSQVYFERNDNLNLEKNEYYIPPQINTSGCKRSVLIKNDPVSTNVSKTHHEFIEESSISSSVPKHTASPLPLNQNTVSKTNEVVLEEKKGAQHKNEAKSNNDLSPNYQGVLDIIFQSLEKGHVFDLTLYLCVPCDHLAQDKVSALNHESENFHKTLIGANWYFCESCGINIYGTASTWEEHILTFQHGQILKLRVNATSEPPVLPENSKNRDSNIEPDKANMKKANTIIDSDCASVCSSNSNLSNKERKRSRPHEILLGIAKENKTNKRYNTVGLYCQVCNRYFLYNASSPNSCSYQSHISQHLGSKNSLTKIYSCGSCLVDIFGDKTFMEEHNSLQLHKEMATLNNGEESSFHEETQSSDSDDSCEKQELSNEKGPHFELMKSVLKKTLTHEANDMFFGFYCHLCEIMADNEHEWKAHIACASHGNKINSSECVKKKMLHDCNICNIRLICDEQIFALHQKSLAHEAIQRIHLKKSRDDKVIGEDLTENDVDDDDTDDDEESSEGDYNYDEAIDNSQVSNQEHGKKSPLNQTNNTTEESKRTRVMKKGVFLRGLPQNTLQKDLFEAFKNFGFIKKCSIDKKFDTGHVIFTRNEGANRVFAKKTIFVKNTPISVEPLLRLKRASRQPAKLKHEVITVLSSQSALLTLVNKQLVEVDINRERKIKQIENDLLKALPGCVVHFFGSQVTGLANKFSDIDIYVDYNGTSYYSDLPQVTQGKIIMDLLRRFKMAHSSFRVMESVLDARVPIIRVIHKVTNLPCDLSFRNGISVENSQLIRLFADFDARVRWLVNVVKWWMRSNDLLYSNIFTSYATTWLVLYFLMHLNAPVLCPVSALRRERKPWKKIAHWDCWFDRNINKCFRVTNKDTPVQLLAQFFEMYGHFKFSEVVLCPLVGFEIPRKCFQTKELPPEFEPYFVRLEEVRNAEVLRLGTPLCFQDPFDLSHNITKGVSQKHLKKFQDLCIQSFDICKKFLK